MDWLQQILSSIQAPLKWWFMVLPWEQALRIRLGKHVKSFGPGVHICVPFIDVIYVQNTRVRVVTISPQTLTTADGKTLTCSGSIRFIINDIQLLYETLHSPDNTICQQAAGLVAGYIAKHNLVACTPNLVAEYITTHFDLTQYGLGKGAFFLTDFAVVQTFRVIGGDMDSYRISGVRTSRSQDLDF